MVYGDSNLYLHETDLEKKNNHLMADCHEIGLDRALGTVPPTQIMFFFPLPKFPLLLCFHQNCKFFTIGQRCMVPEEKFSSGKKNILKISDRSFDSYSQDLLRLQRMYFILKFIDIVIFIRKPTHDSLNPQFMHFVDANLSRRRVAYILILDKESLTVCYITA